MKIAFCFPGQGSQDVGMGRAIAEEFPAAKAVFDEASEAVGFDVARLCFEGPIEELTRTEMQQPALVATSIACLRAVESVGITPDFVVGHSVGEYSALAAAGAVSDRDALFLVRERGQKRSAAGLRCGTTAPRAHRLQPDLRRAILHREVQQMASAVCSSGDRRAESDKANETVRGEIICAR